MTTMMERSETKTEPQRRTPVRVLRKAAVAIVGLTLMIAGVAMLVLRARAWWPSSRPRPPRHRIPTARRLSTRLNTHAKTAWHKVRAGASRVRTRRG